MYIQIADSINGLIFQNFCLHFLKSMTRKRNIMVESSIESFKKKFKYQTR